MQPRPSHHAGNQLWGVRGFCRGQEHHVHIREAHGCQEHDRTTGEQKFAGRPRRRAGYFGRVGIQTVLVFVNSRMQYGPSSRPWPEAFTPPKGTRGSLATIWLMKTIPDSRSLMNCSRSPGSLVQALAPRPKRLSLAMAMASSMFLTRNRLATGPKNSSR